MKSKKNYSCCCQAHLHVSTMVNKWEMPQAPTNERTRECYYIFFFFYWKKKTKKIGLMDDFPKNLLATFTCLHMAREHSWMVLM